MSGLRVQFSPAQRPRRSPTWTPRPRPQDESGAGLVEFALVLPLLMMILFGIIEFGIAFNRAQSVEAAAREGARLGSLTTTTSGDITARVNAALAGLPAAGVIVNIPTGTCAGRQGQPIQVQVTLPHTITIPLAATYNVNLTGDAVFRCEA